LQFRVPTEETAFVIFANNLLRKADLVALQFILVSQVTSPNKKTVVETLPPLPNHPRSITEAGALLLVG
jgi:hypothetical protein